jgi:hypothetical protein
MSVSSERGAARQAVRAVLLALVVATVALVVPAQAASQGTPRVIRVLEITERFEPIGDAETWPPEIGAGFVLSGGFYEWAGPKRGKRVGGYVGIATVTDRTASSFTATGWLPGGEIMIAGRLPFDPERIARLAVVGGTGRYAGARGTLSVKTIGDFDSDRSALTFRLVP